MEYLTFDHDRTVAMIRESLLSGEISRDEIFDEAKNAEKQIENGLLEEICDLSLSKGITITSQAMVDSDGNSYEKFSMLATMRFTRDQVIYFSNGYFAVPVYETINGVVEALYSALEES